MKRRDWLQQLGILGASTVVQSCLPTTTSKKDSDAGAKEPVADAYTLPENAVADEKRKIVSCVLTPEQVEGPFYFDPRKVRKDITEGRSGTPLELELIVVEVKGEQCLPLEKVVVDAWHADAGGLYSGYPNQGDKQDIDTSGKTFMRGTLLTDAGGKVSFSTVFPGWYTGRVPHVHIKLRFKNATLVTSQVYFPAEFSKEIYKKAPYTTRGQADTEFDKDIVLQNEKQKNALMCSMEKTSKGYKASIVLGVKALSG